MQHEFTSRSAGSKVVADVELQGIVIALNKTILSSKLSPQYLHNDGVLHSGSGTRGEVVPTPQNPKSEPDCLQNYLENLLLFLEAVKKILIKYLILRYLFYEMYVLGTINLIQSFSGQYLVIKLIELDADLRDALEQSQCHVKEHH